jgi:RNA polymerase-associated protein CTR9
LIELFKALLEFNKGNYQESLKFLKAILEHIRFGIGLCYFRLGNIEKARFAFQRTIELEPTNSMALIALAILELST